MSPRVSVCVPTRNRSGMLRETLDSVLAQTFRDFELIVTDNQSTDDTEQVVASLGDPRARYVRNAENLGMFGNWNRGIELARGEMVAVLHDDDTWEPGFLEAAVAALDSHPSAGMAVTGVHLCDAQLRPIEERIPWRKDGLVEGREALRDVSRYNPILCPGVIVRASAYREVGPYRAQFVMASDWEMWMRIMLRRDVATVARPLARYRTGHGSATDGLASNPRGMLRMEEDIVAVLRSVRGEARALGDARSVRTLSRALALHETLCGMWRARIEERGAALASVARATRESPLVWIRDARRVADVFWSMARRRA